MRTFFRNPCGAIVVWTAIASIAWGIQAANAPADAKQAKNGLPNAQGSTLVVFKEKPAPASGKRDPLDWPMWRGPEQNGISRETGLIDRFNEASGENVLWRNEEAGGISTPVIMNGRLYTMVRHEPETQREQEKVLCLDAATGEKLWESRHNVYLSGVPAERVGWSCVAADPETDRVYAQGVNGYFQCLDGATGKEIWSRSMHEEYGLLSTYGGRTNTPVVFEDLIIVHSVVVGWGDMATPAHRFIAMDKNTGEVRWFNGTGLRPEDTTFATPVITVLGGEAAMVFGSCDGSVWAFQPRTGKPLWNYRMSRRGINTTPVVQDDMVYASQGEETLDNRTMGSVAAIHGVVNAGEERGEQQDRGVPQARKWLVKGITAGKGSPLLDDGRLYVADDGANLHTLDAETGKRITPRPTKLVGTMLSSSPVWADGKIYVMSTGAIEYPDADRDWCEVAIQDAAQHAGHHHRLAGDFARPNLSAAADGTVLLGNEGPQAGSDRATRGAEGKTGWRERQAGVGAGRAVRSADAAGRKAAIHGAAVQRARAVLEGRRCGVLACGPGRDQRRRGVYRAQAEAITRRRSSPRRSASWWARREFASSRRCLGSLISTRSSWRRIRRPNASKASRR